MMKVRVRVGKSRIAGQGLFTAQDIKQDTRIIQYVGERISKAESAKRIDEGNVYIFTFSGQYDIDGKVLSNTARYINHSCDPNCTIDDQRCVVTIRPVAAGEELTFSYVLVDRGHYERSPEDFFWHERWTFDCRCGSPNCVGRVDRYLFGDEA